MKKIILDEEEDQAGEAETRQTIGQKRVLGSYAQGSPETDDVVGKAPRTNTRAMILLDTNVLVHAFDSQSPFSRWARETIADAVADGGAAINAVSLAEICVGDRRHVDCR